MTTSPVEERIATRDTEPAATAPAAGKIEIVVSVPTVVKALAILFGLVLVVVARDAILSIVLAAAPSPALERADRRVEPEHHHRRQSARRSRSCSR